MKILQAASEAFPFCKTGGLADVTGALSRFFAGAEGVEELVLFLPKYRNAGGGAFSFKAVPGSYVVPVSGRFEKASLYLAQWGKVKVYFVENQKYFDRPGLYRGPHGDYQDNDERFIFFSRAVLEGAKFLGFKPDIIHCHDWQTALIPAYLKTLYLIDAFFAKTATVFTVHNIAYQGMFGRETFIKAGFGWMDFTPDKLEFYGGINFMKAGIVFADFITTVSPTYALEIQSGADFGKGLEGVLKSRSEKLFGILNGIDTEIWDPATDTFIYRGYDHKTFWRGKPHCKKSLQKELGLKEDKNAVLAGCVSRLDWQKGIDIIAESAGEFCGKTQFVFLGVGEPSITQSLKKLSDENPGTVAFINSFDEEMAHKIYASCDIFLMPSRFEPCGLSQMIAMRYGALPVVNATGGLRDTVFYDKDNFTVSNGFSLGFPNADNLKSMLGHILSLYSSRELWNSAVKNAMKGDYSWNRSAAEYLKLFGLLKNSRY